VSTAQIPALNMDKLNAFVGQFVADLGAAVHTGMVVIGEARALQSPRDRAYDSCTTCGEDENG
jgi:hypothetical protein